MVAKKAAKLDGIDFNLKDFVIADYPVLTPSHCNLKCTAVFEISCCFVIFLCLLFLDRKFEPLPTLI